MSAQTTRDQSTLCVARRRPAGDVGVHRRGPPTTTRTADCRLWRQRRPGQMGPRPGRGRAGGAVPRSRLRRNPKGTEPCNLRRTDIPERHGPTYPRDTVLTIEYAQPHGSCWALPSSVWRRLHGPECWALPSSVWRSLPGPECGLRFRCSSSTMRTNIAFLLLGSSDVRTAAVARPSSRLAYHGVPGQPLGNGYAMRPRLTATARTGSSLAPERCASIAMRALVVFQHPA